MIFGVAVCSRGPAVQSPADQLPECRGGLDWSSSRAPSMGGKRRGCVRVAFGSLVLTKRQQLLFSQNIHDHRVKRKPKVVIEGRKVNRDVLSGRSFTIASGSGITKAYLAEGPLWDEGLVDAPSEDECLDDPSEEEEEVSLKEELVLVDAASATDFGEIGAEKGLPRVASTHLET
ncbi:hypothetical protein Cgig2_028757 [Carnegiea gigantea]|uniref:Uncharacterized protein n=1 Tax=Carnegiea gigantea TaxID=171969 RepID=A0A9Q1JQI0_9CARY|nr:hypothetical protein Cgig2_028757 [Carnegiea gigantea]